jgi:prepilin-type N-terminal cleavage/methylation domain-containing protein
MLTTRRHGFTLLELMVVVAIMGMLAAIAVPQYSQGRRRAAEDSMRASLRLQRAAVYTFYADSGCFPLSLGTLDDSASPSQCLSPDGITITFPSGAYRGPYLSQVETDAVSGSEFAYATTGSPPTFKVSSSATGSDSVGAAFSSY